jgi:ribulose-phosphate 3-epimerase
MSAGPLIAPSILSADFGRLADEVGKVERGGADWIHVDVMDGHFVPNITAGPVMVSGLKKHTALPLDVHLMIENPEKYIPSFAKAGAWMLTVHLEACKDPAEVLRLIKASGCRAGMSVRPKTPIEQLDPFLKDLDMVLVMTVEPGFGGQSFMGDMLPKVRWTKDRFKKLGKSSWVEVDGGINAETAPLTVQAGADVLVAGSAVFAKPDPGRAVQELRMAAAAVPS